MEIDSVDNETPLTSVVDESAMEDEKLKSEKKSCLSSDGLSENNILTNEISEENTNLQSNAKENANITVSKTSILRGTSIYVYLKDSEGNPISDKNITLTIDGKEYLKTTDDKGAVSLKFNLLWGKYPLKVKFNGDSNYNAINSSFSLHIYKLSTNITVTKSVARGKYLYVYLKDAHGNALSGMNVTISFKGKNYIRPTNENGRAYLKISSAVGKYKTIVTFPASVSYSKSTSTFTLDVYKTQTSITVASTSVVRGRYLYAYLKDSNGNPLVSQKVTINFDGINFYRTTDNNGRVYLKINTKLGTFATKIVFSETGYYKGSSKSFKLTSYMLPTKFIANSSVLRGKYFYADLIDSQSNKTLANQKVVITFGTNNYTKVTNSLGRVELLIGAYPKNYSVKLYYAGNVSYKSVSKSFTLNVLSNSSAKIIAKSQTSLGEYSIRIIDLDGNPIANQTINVTASTYNHTAGSGNKITSKTIIIDTDMIYTDAKDKQYMKDLAAALKAKGYKVIISQRGPNAHCTDVMGNYSNATVLCLFGGVDSGMFVDMSAKWYQNLLKKYNNRVVLGYLVPPNTYDLATLSWLVRAHDDDYSPSNFTGLAYPGTYLNQHGMDYIYGRNVTEMANNFVNYAVKGLSIGLNNTLPQTVQTYTLKTNENGYATLSGLTSGNYTINISYSNTALGYVADSLTTKVQIL